MKEPEAAILNPYERLYGKTLTKQATTEARFNLGGYLKLLVEMDRANRVKQKHQERNVNEQSNGSRNNTD